MDYNLYKYTGMETGYEYTHITKIMKDNSLIKYCNRMREQYRSNHKDWNDIKNSIWIARIYLSVKMILSASVLLETHEYCNRKNVRIVEPYLLYYSLLCCCRALIFTLPNFDWDDGKMKDYTHSKIINIATDSMKTFHKDTGILTQNLINDMKSIRELFSYSFPAEGLRLFRDETKINSDKVIEICALICELAQLNSEIMDAMWSKHLKSEYAVIKEEVMNCYLYHLKGEEFLRIDQDDWYRLDYTKRKVRRPHNIYWTMTEGLTEDFFGAWCADDEEGDEDIFDPDEDWQIIFNVP